MNIINRFTLRTLRQNKIRTLVTIIGIALSMAMFTGVTSLIVSFQQYLLQIEIADTGIWQGRIDNVSAEVVKNMQSDSEITELNVVQNLGAALDEETRDGESPYVFLAGIDDAFTEFSPIQLVEGRLPKDSTEIVVSQNWLNTHEAKYQIGDSLSLDYGKRQTDSMEPEAENWMTAGYSSEETLENSHNRRFQIVGICQLPSYQAYMDVLPGNILFTHMDFGEDAASAGIQSAISSPVDYTVLIRVKHPREIVDLLEKYQKQSLNLDMYAPYNTHGALLRYEGNSTNNQFNSILYGMGTILMGIIMLGSVSLIFNAFSISVSERTKQFGLLKSIGATKRQIRCSVFFEVLVLSLLGIPIGLLAGLGGIAVTLHFVSNIIEPMLTIDAGPLHLVVTPLSVLLAVIVSFVTVLLSAWIPAGKAVKSPVMQSLRQSNDIRLKGKSLRSNPLVYRIFGFEGMLAAKNYRRNRRKYRATVLSLFMSIVLFVTAASFCGYMQNSVSSFSGQADYDISCGITDEQRGKKELDVLKKEIGQLEGVTGVAYSKTAMASLTLPLERYNADYLQIKRESDFSDEMLWNQLTKGGKELENTIQIYFLEDAIYQDYLEQHHYNVSEYMDVKQPKALAWSQTMLPDRKGKYYTGQILQGKNFSCQVQIEDWDDNGDSIGKYSLDLTVGEICEDTMPLGVQDTRGITLVLPYCILEECQLVNQLPVLFEQTYFVMRSSDHTLTAEKLSQYVEQNQYFEHYETEHIDDVREFEEANRAMMLIIKIFSYGFIVLITLISLANVFNTISTNIALRRQEFAMLKSVGMTRRGFHHMMNYECLLFGFKGLLFGLPTSFGINYLMYRVIGDGLYSTMLIPWGSIGISVVSVFLVVFLTMFYAYHKMAQDNPIEALRNENI